MIEDAVANPCEEPVLRVYQKVNPSTTRIEDAESWRRYSNRLMGRFVHDYRLPIRLFRGASLLDVGCGTGEKSLVFASWGAEVTGVDYNEKALERARYLASISHFPANLSFHNATLPELPAAISGRKFDFVYADGVLHHTVDPLRALHKIAEHVAEGGWLIVRNYQTITSFQRLLKRLIVRLGSGEDDEQITANTRRLFAEDLERSVANGGRMPEQTIYDNFVNPRYKPFGSQVPFQLCEHLGFVPYALTPGTDASILLGPDGPSALVDSLKSAWWSSALARAAVATEPASAILEGERALLERCEQSAQELEQAIERLINKPTGAGWDAVTEAVRSYLNDCRLTFTSLCRRHENQVASFLEEMQGIQPLVRDRIDSDEVVKALPETSVLFRGMSGFPMASWVLWRPESAPLLPFDI